ncbi:hypothetical protein [Propionicicella superfundia]|uniref:hypothetical protein n=1 Tax=Propionicicella superfundia TaxID=348582 RepID=UPI0003FEDEC8|nr:hypothetical protein [Propionicicella superfundia]
MGTYLTTELDVHVLAERLKDPARTVPVVVVTIALQEASPFADMGRLERGLPAGVDVYVVPTGPLTYALADALGGKERGVFGGAGRVYPPGDRWLMRPRDVPLRLCEIRDRGRELTAALLRDAKAAARNDSARTGGPAAAAAAGRNGDGGPKPGPRRPGPPHGGAAAPAASGIIPIGDSPAAQSLASHLHDPHRARPIVVVTRAAGASAPYVDVAHIHAEVGDLCDVVEMSTGQVSWAFSADMEPGTQVYGGASRVYPVGTAWVSDPSRSPLRFAYGAADGPRATEEIIADALRMAHAAGYRSAPIAPGTVPATGRVEGIVGNRGLVRLSTGDAAVVVPELTVDGVPAERLVVKDMAVTGVLDAATGRLDCTGMVRQAGAALAGYAAGDVVLALVRSVARAEVTLSLFPEVDVAVSGDDAAIGGRELDLRRLVSAGEVVRVRVVSKGAPGWRLSLFDLDPDGLPVPAPSVLDGGPPWLVLPSAGVEPEPEPEPEPVHLGVPDAAADDEHEAELLSVTRERDQLQRDLARASRAIERLTGEVEELRTTLRTALGETSKLERRLGGAAEAVRMIEQEAHAFTDPAAQLVFDVDLAWARRFPAAEKARRPLGRWEVGPEFLPTMDQVQGVERSKVVDVIVEIVTGVVHELSGRDVHQLRSGMGGDDPPVTRPDGATCWRVALQQKTPSARRLHFWMRNDNVIELSSIRLHDDFRP